MVKDGIFHEEAEKRAIKAKFSEKYQNENWIGNYVKEQTGLEAGKELIDSSESSSAKETITIMVKSEESDSDYAPCKAPIISEKRIHKVKCMKKKSGNKKYKVEMKSERQAERVPEDQVKKNYPIIYLASREEAIKVFEKNLEGLENLVKLFKSDISKDKKVSDLEEETVLSEFEAKNAKLEAEKAKIEVRNTKLLKQIMEKDAKRDIKNTELKSRVRKFEARFVILEQDVTEINGQLQNVIAKLKQCKLLQIEKMITKVNHQGRSLEDRKTDAFLDEVYKKKNSCHNFTSLSNSISNKHIPDIPVDTDLTSGSVSHLAHLFDKAKKTGQKEKL
ncbi:hypothetical protein C1645_737448 [Glomus cerebriforme]|uniref:Uncharacterized protein n=1 Tax=Glomus cerebriforme TaxID=658196 RepID=A0A397T794_9GLOM|nr:hypothetical protein C1645_737448 [Glomus cerebriforme]